MKRIEIDHVTYQDLLNDIRKIVFETLSTLLTDKYNNQDSLISRKEAAMILKVSEQTIDNYRKKNKLPFLIVGGNVRFKKADVMNLLN